MRSVLLVARSEAHRASLGAYLGGAGFRVETADALAVLAEARGEDAAVVLTADLAEADVILAVRAWWARVGRPVVLVSEGPTRLRADLTSPKGVAWTVLAAPCFGWALVDALRGVVEGGRRPEG